MTDVVLGLQSSLAARYVVEREIGEGATAQVYLARDTKHDRRVALKILRPELTNAVSGERFLREIRVAAGLQHPSILALYDSGETLDSVYFVMPFVEGETLRERLEHGSALPVPEAMRILTEIADALTYAHSMGVIHRDVKPENILLAGGHAFIGDFGIAHAVGFVPEGRLTGEGRVVGTAPYMSPEQAAGDATVDGRSDQYSLACVFHEMLSGRALFPGRTPQSAMSRRLTTPPPRLHRRRRDVPAGVDRALARALAPDPADRFPTPNEFAQTVAEALTTAVVTRRVSWRTGVVAALAAAVASAAVGVYLWRGTRAPPLDRGLYAVMPFVHRGERLPELLGDDCQLLLAAALSHWRDLQLVDELRVKSAYAQYAGDAAELTDALTAARSLGAGMLIWGDVRPIGDSVYVRAALYDVGLQGRTLREFRIGVARGLADVSTRFRQLADSLLLRGGGGAAAADAMGTSSLEAWRAYADAHRALGEWDLERARQGFERAIELDAQYPQAYLGLAQTIGFTGAPDRGAWREAATLAVALRERLAPADREVAAAVLDLAEGRFQQSCARYRTMLARDSLDFRAWYGLGECQAADPFVIADARSRSGWRFRSSQAAAIAAYARALALTPAAHGAFRGRASSRLSELFYTDMYRLKHGYRLVAGDTLRYASFPSLEADTLAFVPFSITDLYAGKPETEPATQAAAVSRNRVLVRGMTERWAAAFPRSADAAEGHARSLEAVGELTSAARGRAGALQLVQRARGLARDSTQAFRLAAAEVRLLLKMGAIADAARLADSVLRQPLPRGAETSMRAAALAAFTGRTHTAAALYSEAAPALPTTSLPVLPSGTTLTVPPPILSTALALSVYAAFGAPADSIRDIWDRAVRMIAATFRPDRRSAVTAAILKEPAALGYPVLGPTSLHRAPAPGALLVLEQQAALLRGDTAMLRARADEAIQATRSNPMAGLDIKYVFHTARQLLDTRDSARALALLDPLLGSLPTAPANLLDDAVDVATLVRTMALRAELAAAARDTDRAARWASGVVALWNGGDPPVADVVRRMRTIAGRSRRF
jgi:tRNA A-37 threonylcarbamoyl transferase component Bud32/tetratricopeptide (TPR) repeat protein